MQKSLNWRRYCAILEAVLIERSATQADYDRLRFFWAKFTVEELRDAKADGMRSPSQVRCFVGKPPRTWPDGSRWRLAPEGRHVLAVLREPTVRPEFESESAPEA